MNQVMTTMVVLAVCFALLVVGTEEYNDEVARAEQVSCPGKEGQ